jgi:hypothetical protein
MDRRENPFLLTIRLPLKPSPTIVNATILVHVLSMFLPWLTGLAFTIKILLTICSAFSLLYLLYRYRLSSTRQDVAELILNQEDDWLIKSSNGEIHSATLGDSLFVHPLLTIILLRYADSSEYFMFTPENTDADSFRRLRVRLRFKVDVDKQLSP